MERAAKSQGEQRPAGPARANVPAATTVPGYGVQAVTSAGSPANRIHGGTRMALQRKLIEGIQGSPRMAAQRKRIEGVSADALQRMGMPPGPAIQFKVLNGDAISALLDQVAPVKADSLPNYVKKVMAKADADAKKPPQDKAANELAIENAAKARFPQFAAPSGDTGSKKVAPVKERKKLSAAGWNHIWRGDIGAKGHPTGFHWKGKADDAINEGHGEITEGQNGFYKQSVKLKPSVGTKGSQVDGKAVKSADKPDQSTFFPNDWKESEVKDAIELRNSQDQITTPEKGVGISLTKSGDTIYPVI